MRHRRLILGDLPTALNSKNVELTDRLCEATFRTIIKNVLLALAKPEDYASRAEILLLWS